MLGAVVYGHDKCTAAIKAIEEFKAEVGKPAWDWTAPEKNVTLNDKIAAFAEDGIKAAYSITDKVARKEAILAKLKMQVVEKLAAELAEDEELQRARSC